MYEKDTEISGYNGFMQSKKDVEGLFKYLIEIDNSKLKLV